MNWTVDDWRNSGNRIPTPLANTSWVIQAHPLTECRLCAKPRSRASHAELLLLTICSHNYQIDSDLRSWEYLVQAHASPAEQEDEMQSHSCLEIALRGSSTIPQEAAARLLSLTLKSCRPDADEVPPAPYVVKL